MRMRMRMRAYVFTYMLCMLKWWFFDWMGFWFLLHVAVCIAAFIRCHLFILSKMNTMTKKREEHLNIQWRRYYTKFSHVLHMKMAIKLGQNCWWQWRWRWQRPWHTQYLSCAISLARYAFHHSLPHTFAQFRFISAFCVCHRLTLQTFIHKHTRTHTHTRRKYQIHLICILHGWVIIVISNEGSLNSGNIIMGHKYLNKNSILSTWDPKPKGKIHWRSLTCWMPKNIVFNLLRNSRS